MNAIESFGIYIHIPVCNHLCGYCDFYSVSSSKIDSSFWNKYLEKLKEEFEYKKIYLGKNYYLTSIYFGGGTPSLAPLWFLKEIISWLISNTDKKARKIEISLEANPETIQRDHLTEWAETGINRLSVGIQSFQNNILKTLDRNIEAGTIYRALEYISEGPIGNWNGDLIYGIPGQSLESFLADIDELIKFNPAHISPYALTMENYQIGNKKISEKRQGLHQSVLWPRLIEKGYDQYEVSNFARNKFYCVHNLSVWKYRPYLSLGTSGHSFIGNYRFRTISQIERYLFESFNTTIFKEKSRVFPDLFITALRLKNHQRLNFYKNILGREKYQKWEILLKEFQERKWVKLFPGFFSITSEGLNYSNSMLEETFSFLS